MTTTYLTKNRSELKAIDTYTDATQTVRLSDGRYGFCDGFGGVYAKVVAMIPGYDYVYGVAVAGPEHTNAHDAIKGNSLPTGCKLHYQDKIQ